MKQQANALPFDIAIVGLGVVGVRQITNEAEAVLKRCRRVFVSDRTYGVLDYLKTICRDVVDLDAQQDATRHRHLVYREFASRVVTEALEEPTVAFATFGHPHFYCLPTTLIERAAQVLDLRVAIYPGISSLDAVLAELGADPALDGLQLYEATDLLIRQRPLQPDVLCVLMQAPFVLEASAYSTQAQRARNLDALQSHLLQFYPSSHVALFMVSRIHPLLEPIIQRIPLGGLAKALSEAPPAGTLVIPPVKPREIADQRAAAQLLAESVALPPRRPGKPPIGPQSP